MKTMIIKKDLAIEYEIQKPMSIPYWQSWNQNDR